MPQESAANGLPLTVLAEDEQLFRDSVLEFADAADPAARPRDGRARQDAPRAARRALRPGRHGHRNPGGVRRRRRAASSTPCWRSKRCRRSTRRSACSSTSRTPSSINALLRWGSDDLKRRYLPRSPANDGRRLRAVGGRLGQRRLRDGRPRDRARRRRLSLTRPQAVDHQRQRGRTSSSCSPTSTRRPATAASRRSSSSAARPASPSARRRTSSASAPAARAS